MTQRIRAPAMAGHFYPADPVELREMVEALLREASGPEGLEGDRVGPPGSAEEGRLPNGHGPGPKALIAPHAGYPYSGPVAASAYAPLKAVADTVRRVVLLGPAHRYPMQGMALPGVEGFATPLGVVPVDAEAVAVADALPGVSTVPEAHDGEHSLEVHLPFLQMTLGDFTLVPLVVGQVAPASVADLLDALWGGPETLVVVSSDLSHFLVYSRAKRLDTKTAMAIEALEPESIGSEQACGRIPVAGLLEVAKRRRLQVRRLDLRNSGDIAGGRSTVVGYGAWALA